jgi:hypothetical protein
MQELQCLREPVARVEDRGCNRFESDRCIWLEGLTNQGESVVALRITSINRVRNPESPRVRS